MAVIILSINAGSSSLKTTLFQQQEGQKLRRLASAEISAINQPPANLKYVGTSGKKTNSELENVQDHKEAFDHVLNTFLSDSEITEVKTKDDIRYACHRVVQGGDFEEDQLITKETFAKIEALEDLAPLYSHASSTPW